MYKLIRPLLFCLAPESAHDLTLKALHFIPGFCFPKPKKAPVNVLGYDFDHPIGLAAGFDKNAEHLDALTRLGFSFIEVGTVTPRAQSGNTKPRLFRLPEANAIINRMGFNNHGVDALVANIKKSKFKGILGINIGKNKDTSLNDAKEDYIICLQKVYRYASYVTINISSPNTPDLRQLQQGDYFSKLIGALRSEQLILSDKHKRYVPLVVKISPDESDEDLKKMVEVVTANGIDGIIATNTTCQRDKVSHLRHNNELGGLSGQPLASRATECLQLLKSIAGNNVALIASGGIDSPEIARQKLAAGADLLQIYTGLIYKGPSLVNKLIISGIEY
jgi:dihydroorotate dehydrogenase